MQTQASISDVLNEFSYLGHKVRTLKDFGQTDQGWWLKLDKVKLLG